MPGGLSAFNPRERSYTPTGFKETVTPRAMTVAEIEATIAEYRAAPANARRAGFDGVEIHALGSFLIPQFLNPRLNRRTDGYGGDRVARRRLLLEIIDAVAEPWYGKRVGCGWRRIGSPGMSSCPMGRCSRTMTNWFPSSIRIRWRICTCRGSSPRRRATGRTWTR